MDDKILAIYGLCTDFVTALQHAEDCQQNMTDAEVLTTALVAMVFLGGNVEHARALLSTSQYRPTRRSRSRFHRRWHLLQDRFVTLVNFLGELWKEVHVDSVSVMDRFPVALCENYRMPRAKLSQQEVSRGYLASKKRYFYGGKIHRMVTAPGQPVEWVLTPGSYRDGRA